MHFLDLGARTGSLLERRSEDWIWGHVRYKRLGGRSWWRAMHFLDLGARTGGLLRRGELEDRIWGHVR
jgi:hypothetical protein